MPRYIVDQLVVKHQLSQPILLYVFNHSNGDNWFMTKRANNGANHTPMFRGNFSPKSSEKTNHRSPVRARYGVSFVNLYHKQRFSLLPFLLGSKSCYIRPWYIESLSVSWTGDKSNTIWINIQIANISLPIFHFLDTIGGDICRGNWVNIQVTRIHWVHKMTPLWNLDPALCTNRATDFSHGSFRGQGSVDNR